MEELNILYISDFKKQYTKHCVTKQINLYNTTTFFDRLKQVMDYKGIESVNQLAINRLGYKSAEKINRLKRKGTNPSYDIIVDIATHFEDISILWLLTGNGNMFVTEEKTTIKQDNNAKLDYLIKQNQKLLEYFEQYDIIKTIEEAKKRVRNDMDKANRG